VQDITYDIEKNNKKLHYEKVKRYFRENIEDKNGYHKTTKSYMQRHKIMDLYFSILKNIMNNNDNIKSVIDVGCGSGNFISKLVTQFPQFKQIIGIDFLTEMVNSAQDKINQSDKVSLIQADILNIPFNNKNFDITICMDTLHHIHHDDFNKAIEELTRITDKILILEIRNKKNISHFWYEHIVAPIYFQGLPMLATSISEIDNLMENYDFQLQTVKGLFPKSWGCRRLVLSYKRITTN
jgi:ubiquinone/menaquinone biosynthesis C-methylase UbiE